MGRKDTQPSASTVQEQVERIVKESKEIVQGKRDAYSDDPKKKVSPRDAAERTKKVLEQAKASTAKVTASAEDALAIEAARLASENEASQAAKAYGQSRVDAARKPVGPIHVPVPVRPAPIFATPSASTPASTRPEGYDQAKAKNAAEGLAKHIKAKNYNYDRKVLTAWQRVAGIAQDGVYGPAAANALKYFTPGAPKKLFAKSRDGTPYPNTPYPPPQWS
jgi:hypothetical protein